MAVTFDERCPIAYVVCSEGHNNDHNRGSITVMSFMGENRPTTGDQKGVGG